MHDEILNVAQLKLLPLLEQFSKEFYLVGGTAIALQIGHRQSIDFDLFTFKPFGARRILNVLDQAGKSYVVTRRVSEQLNLVVDQVNLTFFEYPYAVKAEVEHDVFRMPDLLSLAAMKAFALGRRAKWKDYVDLFFLLRDKLTLREICDKADGLFSDLFSERLFRGQLAYHVDINYREPVIYMPGFEVASEEIQEFLIEQSLLGVV